MRRKTLNRELAGRLDELNSALDELTETMASFGSARDPDDLISGSSRLSIAAGPSPELTHHIPHALGAPDG
jgi:hypothetical protein